MERNGITKKIPWAIPVEEHKTPIKSPKTKPLVIIVVFIAIIGVSIFSFILYDICTSHGGYILDSAEFSFDSEAEVDEELFDVLYYDLDNDSRKNVTNETYYLLLSIPELDYSIGFDYLFDFIGENVSNVRIEQHSKARKITSFERRDHWNAYNVSIEFIINSQDPDVLDVSVFPPDNIIYGELVTYSVDSWMFFIHLDEGEWGGELNEYCTITLSYNHVIIIDVEFHHRCPFKS